MYPISPKPINEIPINDNPKTMGSFLPYFAIKSGIYGELKNMKSGTIEKMQPIQKSLTFLRLHSIGKNGAGIR